MTMKLLECCFAAVQQLKALYQLCGYVWISTCLFFLFLYVYESVKSVEACDTVLA